MLIGHGGGIACLLLRLTGSGFDRYPDYVPGSAAVTLVEVEAERLAVKFINASPGEFGRSVRSRLA
ncbi:hypothetical protein [Kitasatospora arboriphila]|uniref:Histidine phosphatase family protein n=1 Tax=Kitasatospora arboriphila TaxID=258052 RepID=A0ABN1U4Q8_9ACTN